MAWGTFWACCSEFITQLVCIKTGEVKDKMLEKLHLVGGENLHDFGVRGENALLGSCLALVILGLES